MWPLRSPDTAHQRLQSDLQRTRLSRHRLIWLLPRPLSSLPSASCFSFSAFLCVADRAYWRYKGEGVWEQIYHTTARMPGPINHSILSAEHRSGYWLTFSSFTTGSGFVCLLCSPRFVQYVLVTYFALFAGRVIRPIRLGGLPCIAEEHSHV